ncbi:hypothetical protein ABVK25_010319 [Lepraria finkii]|uniref:Uncharacterized protein n=1 Tax=Lepraria finkii TaxID=1340010 RepID=A0ABR4AUQ2_9LECA
MTRNSSSNYAFISDLGLELAHAILTAGHKVIASSRYPSETADAINALGGAWISLDVAAADVDSRIQGTILKYEPIDVLINNVGYAGGRVTETYSSLTLAWMKSKAK